MSQKTNIKKLILLVKLLIEEKEECESICHDAKREFEESIMQAHYDFNVHDDALDGNAQKPSNDGNDDTSNSEKHSDETVPDIASEEQEKPHHPAWIKKLYRKIAIITHPDKMQSSASAAMKERFLDIYRRSKICLESYDYMSVIIFATDIDVKIPKDEVIKSGIIDTENKKLRSEISSIKNSVYWQWANSTPEEKEKILKDFVTSRGWMSKENQRKKSRKGAGSHPGKSISQMKKSKILKEKK